MLKVSDFMPLLRQVAVEYDWFIDGGRIYGQTRRRRSERSPQIEPLVAVMRALQGSRRINRYRRQWLYSYDPLNVQAIHRACQRPGRRGHNTREKWIRKLIVSCLNLRGTDD
jgi:hypothetical protein